MGRDFRPKGKGGAAPPARPKQRDSEDDDVSEEELLRQVQALGGTEEDVALLRSKGSETQLDVRTLHLPRTRSSLPSSPHS